MKKIVAITSGLIFSALTLSPAMAAKQAPWVPTPEPKELTGTKRLDVIVEGRANKHGDAEMRFKRARKTLPFNYTCQWTFDSHDIKTNTVLIEVGDVSGWVPFQPYNAFENIVCEMSR